MSPSLRAVQVILSLCLVAGCAGSSAATGPDTPATPPATDTPDAVSTPKPGAEGAACGSRGLANCAEGLFCLYPVEAFCGRGDKPGACAVAPSACTFDYTPVCGCDGKTYGNACGAHGARTSVESAGECPAETAP